MPDNPSRVSIKDWNGREIFVARSRRGVTAVVDPSDNLIRGGVDPWPPPEVVQKAYQSRQARAFSEEALGAATAAWGYYSDLQSLHSEDAATWSVFGPLVYGSPEARNQFAQALLRLLDLEVNRLEPAQVWLWRRIPHPDNLVPGGPEIDVGVHVGDVVAYGEAKWRSGIGRRQGKAGDKDQIQLRQDFCQTHGQKLYPNARRFIVFGIAQDTAFIPHKDVRCGEVDLHQRSITWSQLSDLVELPHQTELQRYLAWKSQHTLKRK